MITRRGFLARLAAAPIVALALLKAPIAEAEVAPLAFHPDAFKMVMGPLDIEAMRRMYIEPAVKTMVDRHDRRLMEHLHASLTR